MVSSQNSRVNGGRETAGLGSQAALAIVGCLVGSAPADAGEWLVATHPATPGSSGIGELFDVDWTGTLVGVALLGVWSLPLGLLLRLNATVPPTTAGIAALSTFASGVGGPLFSASHPVLLNFAPIVFLLLLVRTFAPHPGRLLAPEGQPRPAAADPTEPDGLQLVCLADRAALAQVEDPCGEGLGYRCPDCGRHYRSQGGVACFLAQGDAFYEEKYLGDAPVRWLPRQDRFPWSLPLWLMKSGYVWAVRRHVAKGSTVLEIGCASGIRYLSNRYRMIGLDLSASSLARTANFYTASLQADLVAGIPLPDASVDAVISSFVWEHILAGQKPRVLAELRRVLRPGGKLIFLYDVDSRHPLYRRLQAADPERFQQVLIDREGHAGWQNAKDNAGAFEAAGLRVLEHRGKEKLLIGPAMYNKVCEWPGAFRRWARIGLRFESGWRFHLYNAITRLVDETLGRCVADSWARLIVSVCQQP